MNAPMMSTWEDCKGAQNSEHLKERKPVQELMEIHRATGTWLATEPVNF